MIAWLKLVHILALMVWCAGLLALPGLFVHRSRLADAEAAELHRLTRTLFIKITSPAAFVAVVAGTVLLFMRDVFTTWMMLKLVVVGVLVVIHVRGGHQILNLFGPEGHYAAWRRWTMTAATLCTIAGILTLVLAKPVLAPLNLPDWMTRPGGLHSLVETIKPTP
ncbi:hypothetical protein FLL57_20145 [Rhodopseudomonas palustris]|uniref:Protoporphyrinogen IX oxidase n=1 Tax=Rhodopseudomonas palustris (strain DX-1) TaxID=652103 RepID=E6VKN5_RHOPX|nr:CopD family protein [Rhodopseudomonas palustris]QDL99477.1 hypothetical protein FLL57_20145 [Rhodopseudomonas palustris]